MDAGFLTGSLAYTTGCGAGSRHLEKHDDSLPGELLAELENYIYRTHGDFLTALDMPSSRRALFIYLTGSIASGQAHFDLFRDI